MATVNESVNDPSEKFEPQVVVLVDPSDDGTAIEGMERDSLTIELNEETGDFEPHSVRNIQTSATTTDPSLSFTLSRHENAEAMDHLGVRDDADDGRYVRGGGREFERLELWYYEDDADFTTDSPTLVDAFGDCTVDFESIETDTVVALFDVTIRIDGGIWWDATSDLEPE